MTFLTKSSFEVLGEVMAARVREKAICQKNSKRKHDEKHRIRSSKNSGKYIAKIFAIKGRRRDQAESEAVSRGQGRVPTAAWGALGENFLIFEKEII